MSCVVKEKPSRMNNYIQSLLQFFIVDKRQKEWRQPSVSSDYLASQYAVDKISDIRRTILRLKWFLEHENPHVLKDEKIAIVRTIPVIPEIFTSIEHKNLRKNHYIHELGKVCNINPGYDLLIHVGFDKKREEIYKSRNYYIDANDDTSVAYLDGLLEILSSIENFADRYRVEAERVGNKFVAETFTQIPKNPPKTFAQALQFFRLLHFCLWGSYNYHNTIGRFDQYMYLYFARDIASSIIDENSALELLEEFFISFNKDSDLYPGMQQGDNGQSLVLGGLDINGKDSFNQLSQFCMRASLDLHLIDPKINLRVHEDTPAIAYELGAMMTKQGLGFPQYTNDSIAIPALKRWGYSEKDAFNYVVAACWEIIIPELGMDIVNIDGVSFLGCVMENLSTLEECETFAEFEKRVYISISEKVIAIWEKTRNLYMEPAPLMSLMMRGCVKEAKDISYGSKYNNYGIHGTGLASAADALATIKKYIYLERSIECSTFVETLKSNFANNELLASFLRYDAPKMGNDDDFVDEIGTKLLDKFADVLEGLKNDRNGIFRAGTGSAMYYLWHSTNLGASPDGRRAGEAFPCNFSPSLFAKLKGPLSLLKSFSKANLIRVANGGPLTIELHDAVFRNSESLGKVAHLVKTYIYLEGFQLQLNAVNRKQLIDAQKHPERHRNLIVRVWGWSGYFVELDKVYQDHIIKRTEFEL